MASSAIDAWLDEGALYALSGVVDFAALWLAALSAGLLLWQLAWKWQRGAVSVWAPGTIANFYAFWLVAMVLWGGYFFALRIPGLFDITVDRVAFLLLAGVTTAAWLRRELLPCRDRVLEMLMLLFLALCLLSMTLNGFSGGSLRASSPWYMFQVGYLLPFFSFLFAKRLLQPERDYPRVLALLFVLGVYLCLVAFLEEAKLRDWILPAYIGDPSIPLHLDRARGPFLNAAFNGLFLCVAFLAGVALLPLKSRLARGMHILLLSLFPVAIYFTHTRSVLLQFVMIAAGLLFCFRTHLPKWKLIMVPLAILLIALFFQADRLASSDRASGGLNQVAEVNIRFQLVNKSLQLIVDNPLLGRGLGQFRDITYFAPEDVEYQHNHLIGMAAELGLVGVGLYLMILAVTFRRIWALTEFLPEGRFVNGNLILVLGMGMLCVLINNTFVEPTLHTFAHVSLFMFIGMIDGLYARSTGAIAAGTS